MRPEQKPLLASKFGRDLASYGTIILPPEAYQSPPAQTASPKLPNSLCGQTEGEARGMGAVIRGGRETP
jgi:hypothetical protein